MGSEFAAAPGAFLLRYGSVLALVVIVLLFARHRVAVADPDLPAGGQPVELRRDPRRPRAHGKVIVAVAVEPAHLGEAEAGVHVGAREAGPDRPDPRAGLRRHSRRQHRRQSSRRQPAHPHVTLRILTVGD